MRLSKAVRTAQNACILGIRIYQRWISPILGPRCRFYPSCSQYAILCFEKHSLTTAIFKTTRRILCCNPFHPGGVDLP